jgi:hypothetical protein
MRRVSGLSLFVGHHLFMSVRLLILADGRSAEPPVPNGSVVTEPISQTRAIVIVTPPAAIRIGIVSDTIPWMDHGRDAAPSICQLQG